MSFGDYLFWLLIEPLKILFEFLFYHSYKITGSCGWSIVVLSLVINILVLPLYNRANQIQIEAKEADNAVKDMAQHIKKSFKGDEKVMILQTYYSHMKRSPFHYSPLNTLKSSLSLLLQIPFFIAAYSFLSQLSLLNGVSLGPIDDLGAPDALIKIGSLTINLLPILMTIINIVSGFIYESKGGTVKDKLKLVVIALVFLVLLYGSPSGLVFYWTLNNLFSLGKNIVLNTLGKDLSKQMNGAPKKLNVHTVILSCAILTILTGFMIPSDVIVQTPEEMINTFIGTPHTPLMYLVSSSLIATGTFMIWIPIFIYLLKNRFGHVVSILMPAAAIAGVINYIPFNKNFGLLKVKLIYDYPIEYSVIETITNLMIDIMIVALIAFVILRYKDFVKYILAVVVVVVFSFGAYNTYSSWKVLSEKNIYDLFSDDISVPMTTTGNNVVVIMMDRMIGAYIPYLFNERPQLYDQFDGFTFYPNTISFGGHTNHGTPALFGGYEYTPERINARSDELLEEKQNEALRVLPTIFSGEGWRVSVGDPPYAGYQWIPDIRIYDYDDNINAFLLAGSFNDRIEVLRNAGDELEVRLNRNMFCYGLMKTLPYALQTLIYTEGDYNYLNYYYGGYARGARTDGHIQYGVNEVFASNLAVLDALPDIVDVTSESDNCFFMFSNLASHDGSCLVEPDYTPAVFVDNTEYDAAHEDRFTVNGVTMNMDPAYPSYLMYEVYMASCIRLGNWFDYLRENGVYDNTRIIIVADHGMPMGQFDDFVMPELGIDAEGFNPVLLVKDFGSTGFTTSNEFMTNADTPFLALDGVVENPVNPFTGNPIVEADKTGEQLIYVSDIVNITDNHGYQFEDPNGFWVTVRDDISDRNNWAAAD